MPEIWAKNGDRMKIFVRSLSKKRRQQFRREIEVLVEFSMARTAFIVILTKACFIDIDTVAYLSLYFN
jgi:hypothetical protein